MYWGYVARISCYCNKTCVGMYPRISICNHSHCSSVLNSSGGWHFRRWLFLMGFWRLCPGYIFCLIREFWLSGASGGGWHTIKSLRGLTLMCGLLWTESWVRQRKPISVCVRVFKFGSQALATDAWTLIFDSPTRDLPACVPGLCSPGWCFKILSDSLYPSLTRVNTVLTCSCYLNTHDRKFFNPLAGKKTTTRLQGSQASYKPWVVVPVPSSHSWLFACLAALQPWLQPLPTQGGTETLDRRFTLKSSWRVTTLLTVRFFMLWLKSGTIHSLNPVNQSLIFQWGNHTIY